MKRINQIMNQFSTSGYVFHRLFVSNFGLESSKELLNELQLVYNNQHSIKTCIILIGETNCGKTTFISALQKLFETKYFSMDEHLITRNEYNQQQLCPMGKFQLAICDDLHQKIDSDKLKRLTGTDIIYLREKNEYCVEVQIKAKMLICLKYENQIQQDPGLLSRCKIFRFQKQHEKNYEFEEEIYSESFQNGLKDLFEF